LLDKLGFEVFSKSFFYDDIGLMKVLWWMWKHSSFLDNKSSQ
jgi:low temperature requirement protein LtrA